MADPVTLGITMAALTAAASGYQVSEAEKGKRGSKRAARDMKAAQLKQEAELRNRERQEADRRNRSLEAARGRLMSAGQSARSTILTSPSGAPGTALGQKTLLGQ
jgi:hypothetical protein